MAKNLKYKESLLLSTIWEFYHCRNLWKKRTSKPLKLVNSKWGRKEVCDKVMKVFFYEEYKRIMRGNVNFYNRLFDTLQYFNQIGNIDASENIAWKLKCDVRFEDDFKESLIKEDFERLAILKYALHLKDKPEVYNLETDGGFEFV